MNQNEGIELERNHQEPQTMTENEGIELERNHQEPQTMTENERIELEKKKQELQSMIEKQDDRIQKLQSTAFQLANYFFIFQGVIFTVISNGSSSVKCQDWWFPFLLSLISTSLNLFALFVIGTKYKRSLDYQEENCRHYQEYDQKLQQRGRGGGGGAQQQAAPHDHRMMMMQQQAGDPFTKQLRSFYLFLCMSLFVGFSLLTLIGCWWIRCNFKNLRGGGDDDKCVKLCDRDKCLRVCSEY